VDALRSSTSSGTSSWAEGSNAKKGHPLLRIDRKGSLCNGDDSVNPIGRYALYGIVLAAQSDATILNSEKREEGRHDHSNCPVQASPTGHPR
jgi:hypothetical protein